MPDSSFLVYYDLGLNGMGFLLPRVAAPRISSFGSLLCSIHNELEYLLLPQVGLSFREIKDGFDNGAEFGKVPTDCAIVDIKKSREKCVRDIRAGIQEKHSDTLFTIQKVWPAAADLYLTGT